MFDPYAMLAEIEGHPLAASATIATNAPAARPVSQLSQVSQRPGPGKPDLRVAEVASVAAPQRQKPVSSLDTVDLDTADDALDHFEERAAIREHDGGQTRTVAEAEALVEAARAAGLAPDALRLAWAQHPDAGAYLDHLHLHGPATCCAMASALGWGGTRAWQAEARLRAAGLVRLDDHGRACPVKGAGHGAP